MSIQPTAGDWPRYAELARELDAVRAVEQAWTEGLTAGSAEMTTHADRLEERLVEQQARLAGLARTLRFRFAKPAPIPPIPATAAAAPGAGPEHGPSADDEGLRLLDEPARMLRELALQIDRSDDAATVAGERGKTAAVLPRWPAQARNLMIYGIAAVLTVITQRQVWISEQVAAGAARNRPGTAAAPDGNPLVLGLLIPGIFFAIGYLVVRVAGTPRIADPRPTASPRFGFALCFGAGPVILLALILHAALSR